MTLHPPGSASTAAFLCIVSSVLASLIAAVGVATGSTRRAGAFALGLAVWLLLLSGYVASGVMQQPVPWVMLFLLTSNLAAIAAALSPLGGLLARELPLWALVGFQGFRLPLELVLHAWGEAGTIPMTMTWEGSNFDVISGIVALALAPASVRWHSAAWIANGVGLVLLLNVARVSVMSSPLPFAWEVEPPLTLAAHLPYALIVPVCVAGALLGHLVLSRALLERR
ncbi:MAG TPA: hypothetical protein ENK18_02725 [Deltaproteobacteria bacterium]|nr:hypothetical protein [Deltaproteobacteria bacterium]